MWSAAQILPESSNARSEALELFTLLGLDFTPVVEVENADVQIDPDLLYDIADAYAGLVVIYKYLVKYSILPQTKVLLLLLKIKDRLIPAILELFELLRKNEETTEFTLIMAISDRKVITIWPRPVMQLSLQDWSEISGRVATPTEGITYNLALLLEHFWEAHTHRC